mgnify:CR=1 FL=1
MMEKRGVSDGELESLESTQTPEKSASHETAAKGGHQPCGEDVMSKVAESLADAIAGTAAKARNGRKPLPV